MQQTLTDRVKEQEVAPRGDMAKLLLSRLEQEDPLFSYNVPPKVATTYDDESLLGHLRQAYSRPFIIIADPIEITKYAAAGDRVVKEGDGVYSAWRVTKGMKGKIEKVEGEMADVFFDALNFVITVPLSDLRAERRKLFNSISSEHEIKGRPAVEIIRILPKNRFKQVIYSYEGADITDTRAARLPHGAEGIIAGIVENNFFITWAQGPGINYADSVRLYSSHDGEKFYYIKPQRAFKPKEFKLAKLNMVNFQELYENCKQKCDALVKARFSSDSLKI